MQGFVLTMAACSITMSALALVFILVTPLLAKWHSAKSRYYAWLVIVIGLIIPFRPFFGDAVVKFNIPVEAVAPAVAVGDTATTTSQNINSPNKITNDMTVASQPRPLSGWEIAVIIWAAGAVLFLAYNAFKHIRVVRTTRRWQDRIEDGQCFDMLQSIKTEMGINKPIGLYDCPCVSSPMTMGVVRHHILLPHTNFDTDELRHILIHEMVHIRRRDLWFRALTLLATAVHWFNPIVYLAASAIDLLCEISCDDEVVRGADVDSRLRYTETIIGVVKARSKLQTALSTSFYSGKEGMKRRIASIMDTATKRTGPKIAGIVLLVTLGTGFVFATTAVPAIAQPSASNPGDTIAIIEALNDWYVYDNYVIHEPLEGQLNREQAIEMAKAGVLRLTEHLIVDGRQYNPEMEVITTALGQMRPQGDNTLPDSKMSFWYVTLSVPGETTLFEINVHAQTGAIWMADMRSMRMDSATQVNADKALYGFLTDLGLDDDGYDAGSYITAGELNATTAMEDISVASAQVVSEVWSNWHRTDGDTSITGVSMQVDIRATPEKLREMGIEPQ